MSEKSETVNMQVLIAERTYPLKVMKNDEQKVQRAVSVVNEKLKEYQAAFAGKDKQDYMAMCLLNLAVEQQTFFQQQQQSQHLLEDKLNQLDQLLSTAQ